MKIDSTIVFSRIMIEQLLENMREDHFRRGYQGNVSPEARAYRLACIDVLATVEASLPESEQWTSLPDAVGACRTLGDHLSLTRRVLGLNA
jgi:hypothetical protein